MKAIGFAAAAVLMLVGAAATASAQTCTFTLSRSNVVAGPEGPIFGFSDVTASAQTCKWTAFASATWVSVNLGAPTEVTGSGRVAYTLQPNTTGATRTATINAGGQIINVTQHATACVTSLTPNMLTFPYPGFGDPAEQRKSVVVDAPADCHWQHSPWPINLSPNPTFGGIGPGTVTGVGIITLFPGQSSTIVAEIGSLPLTLTRLDPPCVFSFSPSVVTVGVNGGSGSVMVNGVGSDCNFTASLQGTGLTLTSPASGTVPATLTYTMSANNATFSRQAAIGVPNAAFTINQNGPPARTDVSFLSFGALSSGGTLTAVSAPEELRLTIDEQPGAAWSVSAAPSWLVVTPLSGSGPATLRVSVDPAAAAALAPSFNSYQGNVTISTAFAPPAAIRLVTAALSIKSASTVLPPQGVFETPLNNAANLSGAIPVTGWAIDDIGLLRIQIFRDPVAGEGSSEIYIGDAIRVAGARPDIASRGTPGGRSAGWGYMLLSNVLPGLGNGSFTFSAYVDDLDGHRVLLGRRTATFNNAGATRPFGTIDEPAQGQTVSGTVVNRGWVLTPQPKTIPLDGSTIKVYIDGALVGPVSEYNRARPDVKAFFGNTSNANGPEARLSIDTTTLSDGVHTIAWGVIDDNGAAEGIGSRYFTVSNGASSLVAEPVEASRSSASLAKQSILKTDVWSRAGVDDTGWATRVDVDAKGNRTLTVHAGERLELFLDPTLAAPCGSYEGHLLTGDVAGPLPTGASLEAQRGIFRWQTSSAAKGMFRFRFVQRGCDNVERVIPVTIVIGE